jgi:hypothetical protein
LCDTGWSRRRGGRGEHVNRGRDTPSFRGSAWYMVPKLRCTVTIDSVLANCKTQNAFLYPVHAMFRHDCPLAVKSAWRLLPKKTWRDSLPIDMLLSAVSVLVVPLPSSEVPEGLTNYPVYKTYYIIHDIHMYIFSRLLSGYRRPESRFNLPKEKTNSITAHIQSNSVITS